MIRMRTGRGSAPFNRGPKAPGTTGIVPRARALTAEDVPRAGVGRVADPREDPDRTGRVRHDLIRMMRRADPTRWSRSPG